MKKELFLKVASKVSPELIQELHKYKDKSADLIRKLKAKEKDEESLKECIKFINEISNERNKKFLKSVYNDKSKSWTVVHIEDDIPGKEYNIVVTKFYGDSRRKAYELMTAFHYDEEKIYIIDNHAFDKNRGYGSIGLRCLIEFAKEMNFKKVTGAIRATDWEDVDKLEYFYSKLGFKVKLNNENKYGSIVWQNEEWDEENRYIPYESLKDGIVFDKIYSKEIIDTLAKNGHFSYNEEKRYIVDTVEKVYEAGKEDR